MTPGLEGSGLDEKARLLARELEAAGWLSMATTYRVFRPSDGLFSEGGAPPKWGSKGKTWRRRGDFASHLENVRQHRDYARLRGDHPYEGCEIVESTVFTIESSRTPAMDVVAEREEKRKKAKR